jgi:hypothetical protein
MSTQAMQSELSRVRELKRNAEATIELLRSDMESGKVHVRVNQSQEFRREVATAIATEAHPGYIATYQGGHYADPVEGRVYFKGSQAAWNPWSDSINWRIVGVEQLAPEASDVSDYVEWSDVTDELPSWGAMVDAYLESQGEEREPNGDIPEWIDASEVIAHCVELDQFAQEIQDREKTEHDEAISFIESEFVDEIILEIQSADLV